MKKIALSMMVLGSLLSGFANEKVLSEQEQKQEIEKIQIKTIEIITKSMLDLLEQVKKEPVINSNNIKDITLYGTQQNSELFGSLKAHYISTDPRFNLKDSKDSEIVAKCYGAVYNGVKIDDIDKVVSTSKCIKELTAIKMILTGELMNEKSNTNTH